MVFMKAGKFASELEEIRSTISALKSDIFSFGRALNNRIKLKNLGKSHREKLDR